MSLGIINRDYLNDLKKVIDMDGLSGHSIRYINNLKLKDCDTLPEQIEQSYINRMIKVAREVDLGSEVLILSEELQ
jgi:hypothetical protein